MANEELKEQISLLWQHAWKIQVSLTSFFRRNPDTSITVA